MSTNNRLYRAVSLLLTAFLLLPSLFSCSEKSDFTRTEDEKTVVMTAGGFDVPFDVYRYFVLNYRGQFENGVPVTSGDERVEEMTDYINLYTEKSLQSCYGTLSLASDYGMSIDDDSIKQALEINAQNYITEYGGEDGYLNTLAEGYLNDYVFRFLMGVQILQENIYYYMLENGVIPSDDATVNEKLRGDEFVRVKQILIKLDDGDDNAANLALAEQALEKAKNGGDFDELVKEYGEDTNMFMNTDGYYFTRREMLEEFEEAAFALKAGEISDIIETPVGYSILLCCEKEEAYIAANYEKLREQYLSAQFNKLLDARCDAMTLKVVSGLTLPQIIDISYDTKLTAQK